MGSMVWKDDKFGDILLESREDGIKLRKLFGLKMEGDAELAGRVSGLYDIFTSLGSHVNHQIRQEAVSS